LHGMEYCGLELIAVADLRGPSAVALVFCPFGSRSVFQVVKQWEWAGQPKVTLKCNSEEEILDLQAQARKLGLAAQSICDAGRTQLDAGSRTVLGIGPGKCRLCIAEPRAGVWRVVSTREGRESCVALFLIGLLGPIAKVNKVTGHLKLY
jgi:peptidyl-tRNA hydrolase